MRKLSLTAYLACTLVLGLGATTQASAQCAGDCDGSGSVTIGEVVTVLNMALDAGGACDAADADDSGAVEVNDVVAAVRSAANGCSEVPVACGNGVIDEGEDCDVGGTCIGGPLSGTACTQESDCGVDASGRCDGGAGALRQCDTDEECGGGICRRCQAFGGVAVGGGQTCAANCTFETNVQFTLAAGSPISAPTTGSRAVVHSGILGDVPLSLSGSQVFSVGKENANGVRPITLKAESVQLPAIPVSTLACACVRGVSAKTCGGVVLDKAGNLGTPCTDGFEGSTGCPSDLPCAYVHGPGNSGTGLIGCGAAGLTPINLDVSQDSRGSSDPLECLEPGISAPLCADNPIITLDGSSTVDGSTIIVTHTAIGVKVGSCDGFCTNDDPQSQRGSVNPLVLTTGTASGVVLNADGQDDLHNGPYAEAGSAVSCTALLANNPAGASLVGAFTAINQNMLGDIVVNARFETPR